VSRNQGDLRTHAALNIELTKNPSLSNCRIKVNSLAAAQIGSSANQGTVSEYGNPATSRTLAAQDLPQPVKSTVHRYTDENSIHTIKGKRKKARRRIRLN
jgi:hypothetical protein